MNGTDNDTASQLFDQLISAVTCKSILSTFHDLCDSLGLSNTDHRAFYKKLKSKLTSWKANSLWVKLDKRAAHRDYRKMEACPNTKVLIIGAGPCGLRMAIEVALMGAKAVVVEKRDRFSRNNVLHLWNFVIADLRNLGAKKFFGKFCAGSIEHISIRQLQCILLKVALLLGVEVHVNVAFEGLIEPPEDQSTPMGWRCKLSPSNHPVSEYQFDALIGADGKRNTVRGFQRKEFRGKLAIAITANFINRNTNAEARVEEISGVAFIFNQKFFLDLKRETQIDLENIVYYKDETHYFVMTAKKGSLLEKGVLKEDYSDTVQLLSRENVDQEALLNYAKEAANFSTNYQLPNLEYAVNHYGQADIAMFDFTSMFAAENACRAIERHGKRLFIGIVGDSLLEPFWPTGSGCARGFLGVFDAAWMIKSMASGKMTPLQVIAERESIYQLLSQTTPENLHKNHNQYSIDPNTRYPNLNLKNRLKPVQVKHLFDGPITDLLIEEAADAVPAKRARNAGPNLINNDLIDSYSLLRWCQRVLNNGRFRNVHVVDFAGSWRNGLAFCALIHAFRPTLIEFNLLMECDVAKNNQLAFDVAEKELGVPPVMTGEDMAKSQIPDKLTLVSYISQLYAIFRTEPLPTVCDANWEFCEKSGSYVFVRRTEEEEDNPNSSSGNRPAESSNSKQKTKVKTSAASKVSNSLGSTEDMSSESDRKTSKESSSSGGHHLSYEELPDWVKFVGSQQSESDSGETDSDGTAADGSITMWPEQNVDLSGASDSSEDEVYVPVSVKSLKRMYEGPRGYAVTPHHKRALRQKSDIQKIDNVSDIHASSDVKTDEEKSKMQNSEQVTEDIQNDDEQFKTLKPNVENFETVCELKTQTYFDDEFKTLTQENVDKHEASSKAENFTEIKPPEQNPQVPQFVEDEFISMIQEDVEMAEADVEMAEADVESSDEESFVQHDVIALTKMWKQMADKQAGLRPKGKVVSKRKNKESYKKKSAAPKKATNEGNIESVSFEKLSDKNLSDCMTFNLRSKLEEQIDIAGESTFAEETVDLATETDYLARKINHLVNKTDISEKSTDPAGKTDYLAKEKTDHLKKQLYSKTEKTAKTITVKPIHACRETPLYKYHDKQIKVMMLGFPKNSESSTDDLTPVETSLTKEPRTNQSICDQTKLGESGFEACNETIDFKVAKRKFQDLSNESKEMSPSKKLDRKSSLKWRQNPRFRSFLDILKDNHPDATSKTSLEQDQLAGGSQKDKVRHLQDDPVNIKRRVEASRVEQGHPLYVEENDKLGYVNLGETFSLLETSSSTDVDIQKQGVMSLSQEVLSEQESTSKHRVLPNKNIYLSVPSDVNNNCADEGFDSSSNDEFYDAKERLSPLKVTQNRSSSEEEEFEDSHYQSALDISMNDTRLMQDADVFHTVQERVSTSPGTQLANRLQLVSVNEHAGLENHQQTSLEEQSPTTNLPEVNISEA